MNQEKLDFFRNLLLEQRQQAAADLESEREAASQSDGDLDDPTDAAQEDQISGTALEIADKNTHLLEEIDEALARIEEGTYGECEACGQPINEERLKAVPTARYDAEHQAALEVAEGNETPSL